MLPLRPSRLYQAQHRVQTVAFGITNQHVALGMGQLQTQLQTGLAQLQRSDQILAGNQALWRLLGLGVTFITAATQHFARQQAGVALQCHTGFVAVKKARQMHACTQQTRHTCMQHKSHRWVNPLHRRAGSCRFVCRAMGKFTACGPCVAKGGKGGANILAA